MAEVMNESPFEIVGEKKTLRQVMQQTQGDLQLKERVKMGADGTQVKVHFAVIGVDTYWTSSKAFAMLSTEGEAAVDSLAVASVRNKETGKVVPCIMNNTGGSATTVRTIKFSVL